MKLTDGPPVVTDDGDGGDATDCVKLGDSPARGLRGGSRLSWGRRHALKILFAAKISWIVASLFVHVDGSRIAELNRTVSMEE
jgi:hypothetical protein